jgi:hypothetical protein
MRDSLAGIIVVIVAGIMSEAMRMPIISGVVECLSRINFLNKRRVSKLDAVVVVVAVAASVFALVSRNMGQAAGGGGRSGILAVGLVISRNDRKTKPRKIPFANIYRGTSGTAIAANGQYGWHAVAERLRPNLLLGLHPRRLYGQDNETSHIWCSSSARSCDWLGTAIFCLVGSTV